MKEKVYKAYNHINNNILPGDLSRSPDESFFSKTLVFVDAGFLSKLSKSFGDGEYLVYDLVKFCGNLSKKQGLNCKKVFYYNSPPFQSTVATKEEERRRDGYDRFVNKIRKKGIIVREGRCQRLNIGGEYKYGQKAVDILLAMDLMNVPLNHPEVKRVILISSDSDFVPVVNCLRENGVKTVLYTYYKRNRGAEFSRSNYLIKSVYKYVLLARDDFDMAKLDEEVGNDE